MNSFHVPPEWEHVVCICAEDHGTKTTDDIFMKCRSCDKLKRFYGSHCRKCKKFYLMVFEHPIWTPSNNLCFECCDSATHEYCSPDVVKPPADKYRYPAVLKTTEELGAELDDMFADW